jgi:hypothetical protein
MVVVRGPEDERTTGRLPESDDIRPRPGDASKPSRLNRPPTTIYAPPTSLISSRTPPVDCYSIWHISLDLPVRLSSLEGPQTS